MTTRLVIFDLDGTLLNTIADLAGSTNYALACLGYPTHPIEAYPMMVGNGVRKLFERALPEQNRNSEEVERMRSCFLTHYDLHNTDCSEVYEGLHDVLRTLRDAGVMMAVASNKYHEAVVKLMQYYFPDIPFVAVYGQRDGIAVKPDVAIVRDIMSVVESHIGGKLSPEEILFVGDSGVDMQTAAAADIPACGVTWGFRPVSELNFYTPRYIVDTPEALLRVVLEDK